jgi:flagellar hook-associated protein 3 FlgL
VGPLQGHSSLSRLIATQSQLTQLDRELAAARQELASGRVADTGVALGARTTDYVDFSQRITQIVATTETNKLVAMKLDATQVGLGEIHSAAKNFLDGLVAARGNANSRGLIEQQARNGFQQVLDALSTRSGGENLFSGLNVDRSPLEPYFAEPPTAGRTLVSATFFAHFGMTQSDAGVATIDASSMQAYVNTDFASLFDDATWAATWSSATNELRSSRIGGNTVIDTSVSANDASLRKIVQAFALVSDSGIGKLTDAPYEVVLDKAIELIGHGMSGLAELEGTVGMMQSRVNDASEAMEARRVIMERAQGELVEVDPAEVSTRLSELIRQVEAAYTITARLQRLSLLDVL